MYYRRLQRDGWALKAKLDAGWGSAFTVFEKDLTQGWILHKYAHAEVGPHPPGHGCYWDEHEIEQPEAGRIFQYPKWEWAERDGDTLVFADAGCLYRARLSREGLGEPRLLHDFNGMGFERILAPYQVPSLILVGGFS